MKNSKIKNMLFITAATSSVVATVVSASIVYKTDRISKNENTNSINFNNEIAKDNLSNLTQKTQIKSNKVIQKVVYNQLDLAGSEIIPNLNETQNESWINSIRTTIISNPTFTYLDASSEDQIRKQIWSLIELGTNFQTLNQDFTSIQLKQNSSFTISNITSGINGFVYFSLSINTSINDSSNKPISSTFENGLKSNGIIGISGFKMLEQNSPLLSSFQINTKQSGVEDIIFANSDLAYQFQFDTNNDNNIQQMSKNLKSFVQQNWIYIFDITNGQLPDLHILFDSINIYAPIDIQKDSIRFKVLFMNKMQNGEVIPAQKTIRIIGISPITNNQSIFDISEIIGISLCLGGGVLLLIAMLIVLIKKSKNNLKDDDVLDGIPDDLTDYIIPEELKKSTPRLIKLSDNIQNDEPYYLESNYQQDLNIDENFDNQYINSNSNEAEK